MPAPFEPVPFDQLPAVPRVPHPWFDVPARDVETWTQALGDVTTRVRVVGQGPPLLLVHGLMTTGYSWRYVVEPLARHHTVYVPDLVGAGDTLAPDRRLTPDVVSDWLRALMDTLGILGCDVVGNSMGGYLAMSLALRHPRVMRRLVVVHAPATPELRLWALWLAIRLPFADRVLAALVRRDPERWVWRNVHYWDETLKSREETRTYSAPLVTRAGLRGFWRQLRDMMDVTHLRWFAHTLRERRDASCDFPVPLTLLYARQDPMVAPRTGRALKALVPSAALVWLDDASHFAHVDAPEAFLREVARALPV